MYKSFIEKISKDLQTRFVQEDENMVMEAVRNVGIYVNKEELIKALQYDRGQYEKGYSDGKSDTLDKIGAEIADLADTDAYGDYQQGFSFGLMKAVEIIEKYKEEA